MQYLITTNDPSLPCFFSPWFEPENHFNTSVGMVVYDLINAKFTTDGKEWNEIIFDHL